MFDGDSLPTIMIVSFAMTIIIENIFALFFGVRSIKDFLNIILVNIVTNPIVVSTSTLINIKYGYETKYYALIPIELAVVVIEGFIYKKTLRYKGNPFKLSFILNVLSFFIGYFANQFIYY